MPDGSGLPFDYGFGFGAFLPESKYHVRLNVRT